MRLFLLNSVALSGVVNTIDKDNRPHYKDFDNMKQLCVVTDFMMPTKHHLEVVDKMLKESRFLRADDIDALDIWVTRRACDLRELLMKESPFYEVPDIDNVREELTICTLVHIL